MKRELDLGTNLKSGLNIAVYYDVTRKSGNTLELFFFSGLSSNVSPAVRW